jgi:TonB family protein
MSSAVFISPSQIDCLPEVRRHVPVAPPSFLGTLRSNEDQAGWSWLLAFTACFLVVGIIGLQGDLGPNVVLRSYLPPSAMLDSAADSAVMADLVSTEAAKEITPELAVEVAQEIPPAVELVTQTQELPDLVEALATEDLFTLSTAPKIEETLRPKDPSPQKPELRRTPTPTPARSAPKRTTSTRTSGTGTGSGTGASGSGSGSGSGGGAFIIPRPTYPSSLRSLGVQGTVKLRITVGTSGRASSVTVIGTSGNSTLDQYAAGWVRRNGKAPPGEVRTVIAPLSFVLR